MRYASLNAANKCGTSIAGRHLSFINGSNVNADGQYRVASPQKYAAYRNHVAIVSTNSYWNMVGRTDAIVCGVEINPANL